MQNNFYEVNGDTNIDINNNQNLNIIFFVNDATKNTININLQNNVNLNSFITIINNKMQKSIDINVNCLGSNIVANVRATSLNLNESSTQLNINGIANKSINSEINIFIDGIIDSDGAKFIGCPKFILNTNEVKATHGLVIGKVNENEMNYLMCRGMDQFESKLMIISNKIFNCLNNLDEYKKNYYKQKIIDMWG